MKMLPISNRFYPVVTNICALLLVIFALLMPNRINEFSLTSLRYFPVEIIVLGALLLLPGRAGLIARWVAAAILALGLLLKCADIATHKIFARPFNPVFDGYLFADGMNLLNGAVGKASTLLIAILLIVL